MRAAHAPASRARRSSPPDREAAARDGCEVAEPDLVEERAPRAHVVARRARERPLGALEGDRTEGLGQRAHGEVEPRGQRASPEDGRGRVRREASARARGAGRRAGEGLGDLAARERREQARPRRAPEQPRAHVLGEGRDAVARGDARALDGAGERALRRRAGVLRQACEHAGGGARHARVAGQHLLGIGEHGLAEAVARRAGARGPVGREERGAERGVRHAAAAAERAVGERRLRRRGPGPRRPRNRRPRLDQRPEHPASRAEALLDAVGEAGAGVLAHDEAVDHGLDGVVRAGRRGGRVVEADHPSADARAHEAVATYGVEGLGAAPARREEDHPRALGAAEEVLDHALGRVGPHRVAAAWAVRRRGAREQEAQAVGDLGDGAERLAGARRAREEPRGHGGRQAVDAVHVGLAQALDAAAGQGAEEAAVRLGPERVEDEGRLPRARDAADHREGLAREVQVDGLEVVGSGPTDLDRARRHGLTVPGPRSNSARRRGATRGKVSDTRVHDPGA